MGQLAAGAAGAKKPGRPGPQGGTGSSGLDAKPRPGKLFTRAEADLLIAMATELL